MTFNISITDEYENVDSEDIEINNSDYQRMIRMCSEFPISDDVKESLCNLALNTYVKKSYRQYASISEADIMVLMQACLNKKSYTLNALKKMNGATTINGLKEVLLPELVDIGLVIKDESGRYVTYTVLELGMKVLFLLFLRDCSCKGTGICANCNGDGKCDCDDRDEDGHDCWMEGSCYSCHKSGRCSYHNDFFETIGSLDRFEEFYQILLNGFL